MSFICLVKVGIFNKLNDIYNHKASSV